MNDLDLRYLASWFTLAISQVQRSRSQVKVHGHRRKNIAKVVGATSSGVSSENVGADYGSEAMPPRESKGHSC